MEVYKCDLCGKYIDDCYGVSGISLYRNEVNKAIGKELKERHRVQQLCDSCFGKIKDTVLSCFDASKWKDEFEE